MDIIKPLTNTERQQRWKDKKIKEIGIEEFNKLNNAKVKKYYRREEKIKEEPKEEFKILEPIAKRIKPINKSILKEETKNSYINALKIIYKNYNKKELESDIIEEVKKLLNNEKYNIKFLNTKLNFIRKDIYNVIKENKTYINELYSIISRMKYYNKTIKELYPYLKEKEKEYTEKRENKKPTEKEEEKIEKVSFKKEKIIENMKNLNEEERILYGLFTLFPTRRAIDYRRMIIINDEPIDKINNYYSIKKEKFYFNNTKNKKKDEFDVGNELNKIIMEYIKDRNDGLLLEKEYKSSVLSEKITRVFKKLYGIRITPVEIRKLYSTYINKYNTDYKQIKEICKKMNHSIEENKKYIYNNKEEIEMY